MITGFNTDIRHGDRVFHVQTEDRGVANPVVESLVYVGGEILLSKKSPYPEMVTDGHADEKAVRSLMDLQHRKVIEAIRRGRFDGKGGPVPAPAVSAETSGASGKSGKPGREPVVPTGAPLSPAAAAAAAAILSSAPRAPIARSPVAPRPGPPLAVPVPPPPPGPPRPARAGVPAAVRPVSPPVPTLRASSARIPSGIGVAPERTLDQVIVDYLSSEAGSEHLEISVDRSTEIVAGETVTLEVKATTSLTAQPVPGVTVTIRIVSTAAPPRVLFRGATGADGGVRATCALPDYGAANAALIVSASSTIGNHEVKHLVRKRSR